jgi:hypothetical protein
MKDAQETFTIPPPIEIAEKHRARIAKGVRPLIEQVCTSLQTEGRARVLVDGYVDELTVEFAADLLKEVGYSTEIDGRFLIVTLTLGDVYAAIDAKWDALATDRKR